MNHCFFINCRKLSNRFLGSAWIAGLVLGFFCQYFVFQMVPPAWAQSTQRNLDTRTPFQLPGRLEQWERRAEQLRLQLRVALGIYPFPELPPIQPQIYGRREFEGYTVEKCTIEALPGFFVTGNLYRPTGLKAGETVPGILSPHGHWNNGRFLQSSDTQQELANGAERFESAATSPLQARCVQLARMGCVVLIYDMIGYADSQQISYQRAHGFVDQPIDQEANEEGWLLYSPLAEAHAQSIMGLQTLSTFRAVDAILSLPEIDPNRIGITGASGGGTQSFIAAALDPRIKAAFPAVMVSTGMQGGCVCENSSLLRVGTNNVEIAALIAPKPLGLTAANDWTRTMPEDGFPELKRVFQLYGNPERVDLYPALHFGHNFNHVSRVPMYGFFNDHFHLGFVKPVLETDFTLLTPAELSVWNHENIVRPESGLEFERKLLKKWSDLNQQQLQNLQSQNGSDESKPNQNQHIKETLTNGWRVVLGLTVEPFGQNESDQQITELKIIKLDEDLPEQEFDNYIFPDPKQILFKDKKGVVHAYSYSSDSQVLVANQRMAAGYTYGYNLPTFARQAQQLALAIEPMLGATDRSTESADDKNETFLLPPQLQIRADGAAAALATAALFCLQERYSQHGRKLPSITLSIDHYEFRFANASSIKDATFLPGSAKYGDWPGLISCLGDSISLPMKTPSPDFK